MAQKLVLLGSHGCWVHELLLTDLKGGKARDAIMILYKGSWEPVNGWASKWNPQASGLPPHPSRAVGTTPPGLSPQPVSSSPNLKSCYMLRGSGLFIYKQDLLFLCCGLFPPAGLWKPLDLLITDQYLSSSSVGKRRTGNLLPHLHPSWPRQENFAQAVSWRKMLNYIAHSMVAAFANC